MPSLGTRHVAHFILKGPDRDVGTHPSVVAKAFRRDVAMTVASGRFGESLTVSTDDINNSALAEWQDGRRAAATSIGKRINRTA
jgi:hypothetical protein